MKCSGFGLELAGVVDSSFSGSVVALAGGYAYPELDEAAVQAVRDSEASKFNFVKWDRLFNEYMAPVLDDGSSSDAAIKAAMDLMNSAWSE